MSRLSKTERWQHHHKRLHQLIREAERLRGALYHADNGYWREPADPLRVALEPRLHRVQRLISECDHRRERYSVRAMSPMYRPWP
jgi:hypothetical protein